jgi:hypothetical protein
MHVPSVGQSRPHHRPCFEHRSAVEVLTAAHCDSPRAQCVFNHIRLVLMAAPRTARFADGRRDEAYAFTSHRITSFSTKNIYGLCLEVVRDGVY